MTRTRVQPYLGSCQGLGGDGLSGERGGVGKGELKTLENECERLILKVVRGAVEVVGAMSWRQLM
jgi:hypothetical protein